MKNLKECIAGAERILAAGHLRPDGDCVGACIALYQYIRCSFPDKTIEIYLETLPERYRMLDPKRSIVSHRIGTEPYDLFVAIDCSSPDRLGEAQQVFQRAAQTICIDHHVSNTYYADINFVTPDSSSACEVLYELIAGERLTPETAAALYVGIAYDSGVFRYSNTSARTMEIAGELIQTGIPFWELIDRCISERSYPQTCLLGAALQTSRCLLAGKCIVSVVTRTMMEQYGAVSEEIDGIVEQLRVTQGVEAAVLLYEIQEGEYKVSLRANGSVDVSAIAVQFGGGGHKKAAGFQKTGLPHDIVDEVARCIEKQL